MDEYQHIRELRQLWTETMMAWARIMVPLGTAIFGFFVYAYIAQPGEFDDPIWTRLFLCIGWLVFAAAMGMWRWIAHLIDRQIVRMYPRMLEIEEVLRMTTHARYYYNNLNRRGRQSIAQALGISAVGMERLNYRQFEREALNLGLNPYHVLLHVWDEHGHRSVTDRGHLPQDLVIGIIISAFAGFVAWLCIAGVPN